MKVLNFDQALKQADELIEEKGLGRYQFHAHAHSILVDILQGEPPNIEGHISVINREMDFAERELARATYSGQQTEWGRRHQESIARGLRSKYVLADILRSLGREDLAKQVSAE